MSRYFAEVEENYPSVVANVARTTRKLMRRLFDNDNDDHSHHSHNHNHQQHPSDDDDDDNEGDNDNDTGENKSKTRPREGCAICGMPLDEQGDERWRGELGIGKGEMINKGKSQLCYGCERAIQG